MKEEMKTSGIYASDLRKLDVMVETKGLKNRAEALRVCIEYAQAHGVF